MSQKDDDINFLLFLQAPNSLWRAAPVEDEPEVAIRDWDIKKDTDGNHYFVGTTVDDGWGRVSTPIVEFDPERRRGRTQSGRVYELIGPGGRSADGEYVWSVYKTGNGITEADQ